MQIDHFAQIEKANALMAQAYALLDGVLDKEDFPCAPRYEALMSIANCAAQMALVVPDDKNGGARLEIHAARYVEIYAESLNGEQESRRFGSHGDKVNEY